MEATDFLFDDGDLKIENGDFAAGTSDADHIEDILMSAPGEWKQHPLVGVHLPMHLDHPLTPAERTALTKKVQLQLEIDGYSIQVIDYINGELIVKAERK